MRHSMNEKERSSGPVLGLEGLEGRPRQLNDQCLCVVAMVKLNVFLSVCLYGTAYHMHSI